MNTKKQKIVAEISKRYEESQQNGVLIYKNDNLNGKETSAFKQKIWEIGTMLFGKNTLLNEGMKTNNVNLIKMKGGSHFLILSNSKIDVFQLINKTKKIIGKLGLRNKVKPMGVLLGGESFDSKKMKFFESFQDKTSFHGGICMMLKIVPIKICKMLELAIKQKEK